MNKSHILVVEDDKAIRNLIATTLETQQYDYHTAETGRMALMDIISDPPQVIILDLGLPDMEGIEVIRKVRGFSNVPIIIVSARSDEKDKIEALDAGADDYLTKPFSTDELLARLRSAIRRMLYYTKEEIESSKVFKNGGLEVDYMAGCVHIDGQELHLTPIEYKLLCLLSQNVGKVLTHNFMLKEIWGSTLPEDTRSLRVFMATLRKKIEVNTSNPKYIHTHVGIGYRMQKIADEP